MFCFLKETHTGHPHVFNGSLDPNSNAKVATTVFVITCPVGITHHKKNLVVYRRFQNFILQPTTLFHTGLPTKYLSKRLTLPSSRVVAVPT